MKKDMESHVICSFTTFGEMLNYCFANCETVVYCYAISSFVLVLHSRYEEFVKYSHVRDLLAKNGLSEFDFNSDIIVENVNEIISHRTSVLNKFYR